MVDSDHKHPLHFLRYSRRRYWYSEHSIFHDILALRTYTFLAFLSRKDNLHRHWCSSWGQYSHIAYMSIHIIFNSGGEGYYCELRSARETSRAHPIFPSTSSSLHIGPTHVGDDGATRENHGPDSVYSCTFDQDNEREPT
jgi:hypothetical protein